jgi:hypothetical protein
MLKLVFDTAAMITCCQFAGFIAHTLKILERGDRKCLV